MIRYVFHKQKWQQFLKLKKYFFNYRSKEEKGGGFSIFTMSFSTWSAWQQAEKRQPDKLPPEHQMVLEPTQLVLWTVKRNNCICRVMLHLSFVGNSFLLFPLKTLGAQMLRSYLCRLSLQLFLVLIQHRKTYLHVSFR